MPCVAHIQHKSRLCVNAGSISAAWSRQGPWQPLHLHGQPDRRTDTQTDPVPRWCVGAAAARVCKPPANSRGTSALGQAPHGPSCWSQLHHFHRGESPSTAGHLENRLHEKSPSTAVKPNTLMVQHTAFGGARPGMNLASRLFVSVIYWEKFISAFKFILPLCFNYF